MQFDLSKKLKSSLAQNAGWMFMGQGISLLVQGSYFFVLTRLLGSLEYGVFVGAFALASIVSQFSTLGSGVVFLRYVSADRSKFAHYWGNVILSSAAVSGILVLLLRLSAGHIINPASAALIVPVAIGECVCSRLMECAGQVFQAFERLQLTAILNLTISCLRLAVACAMTVTLRHADARQWAIASATISVVAAVAAILTVTRVIGKPKFSVALMRRRAWEGFQFSVSGSTTSVYNDIDKTMLSHYGMNAQNGIYSVAYRVIDISTIPIRSVMSAAVPRLFRLGAQGIESAGQFSRRVARHTAAIGALVCLGLFVVSPWLYILTGKGFTESSVAVRWLCVLPFLRSLHLSAGDALTGGGHQRVRMMTQFIVAGFNFAVNLWWIPLFGWRGAAFSSVLTDGMLAVLNWAALIWMERRAQAQSRQMVVFQE